MKRQSRKTTKQLTFTLTPSEYGKFWTAVELLEETQKKPAFLKMLDKIIELYS